MFELKDASNILNISLTETAGGVDVEMTLADGPNLDEAEEHLSFSVRIGAAEYPALVRMQKEALQRARAVIAHEINRLQKIEDAHT